MVRLKEATGTALWPGPALFWAGLASAKAMVGAEMVKPLIVALGVPEPVAGDCTLMDWTVKLKVWPGVARVEPLSLQTIR
jgi:hypothetical protein